MTCDEARRTGDLEHLGSCPACRALLEPRGTFADLHVRLSTEAPAGCDPDALIEAAYGAPAPDAHLASCAACRKRLDDYRAVVARLDSWSPESHAAFPADCAALDEAISLAALGEAAPDHCAVCAARTGQRAAVVRKLDLLPADTRLAFADLRLLRRRLPLRWAAAAALLLAFVLPLLRTSAPPRGFAVTVPAVKRVADALASPRDAEAIDAVHRLRDIGGPVAEQYLIDAMGRRPAVDGAIAGALASMRSTAAVPALIEHVRGGAAAYLPALAEIADPRGIRPLIEALDDPRWAGVAAQGLARMSELDLRPALEQFALGASPAEAAAMARAPHPLVRETALHSAALYPDLREPVLDAADIELLVLAAGASALEDDAVARLRRAPRDAAVDAARRALEADDTAPAGALAAAGLGAVELVESMVSALRRGPGGRHKIARALAVLGDPRGLRALLAGPDDAEALALADAARVHAAAWAVLDDPRTVRTLAGLPLEESAPLLVEALRRRTSRVEAMRALADNRYLPAVPHVIPLLDGGDADEAHRTLVLITGASLPARRADWTHWWMNRRG